MNQVFHQPIPVYAAIITLCVCLLAAQGIIQAGALRFDTRGRIGCVDGLRGLLALGVYFHHYVITYHFSLVGEWRLPGSVFYVLCGHLGVGLFFMVTGLLFWNKILSSGGQVDWRKLYVARFFRLVPLYWSLVLVVLAVVFIQGGFFLKTSPAAFGVALLKWLSFWGSPDLNGFADTRRVIAGVEWTLRYEWFFYIFLPLGALIFALSKRQPLVMVLFVGLVVLLGVKNLPVKILQIETQYFLFFLVGGMAAYINRQERWRRFLQSGTVAVLGLTALLFIFLFLKSGYGYRPCLLLSLFFIPVAMGNSYWGVFRMSGLTLLGEMSYSLYLLHGLLLYCVFTLFFPGFMNAQTSTPALVAGMAGLGVVLVGVSYLTYSYIEKPGIALGRGWIKGM